MFNIGFCNPQNPPEHTVVIYMWFSYRALLYVCHMPV